MTDSTQVKTETTGFIARFVEWRRSLGLPNPGPFEQLHKEVRNVFVTNFLFDGAKFDLGKALSPNFQATHSFSLGSQVAPAQYTFSTVFIQYKTFLSGSMDHELNLQARANYALTKRFTSKFNGQFGAGAAAPSMAQLEFDYQGLDYSSNLKAINPSPVDATGIYVFSHLHSLTKKLALGFEVAAQHPDPSVLEFQTSLVGKYTGDQFVLTANVAQFGVVQTSYFHKLNENVEVGAEVQVMSTPERVEGVCTVGAKWDFRAATVRCQLDTTGRLASVMEHKIVPGFSFLMSADLDHLKGQSKFGMGIQLEN